MATQKRKVRKKVQRKKPREIPEEVIYEDDDMYDAEVEDIEEEEQEENQGKRTNLFYVIIIIILFFLLVIAAIFLFRFLSFDRFNINHSGIPAQSGDEGFEIIGTATVPAIPDIAIVNFSVVNSADNIRDAQNDNSETANKVIEELRKEGVDQDDIQVITYNITPRYRFDEDGNRVLDGFEAIQRFEAKVRAINNAGEILNSLINNGATEISDLRFTLDDIEKLEDEALIKAISDARVLAETSVAATGQGLGRVISITEVEEDELLLSPEFSITADGTEGISTVPDIYAGRQEIRKVVRVQFELN